MAGEQDEFSAAQGRITHGPEPNALVARTIDFIRSELPVWRDRPDRRTESAEERLNAQLCKHLDSAARRNLPAVQFHHEEKQGANHRVDLSAGLVEGAFIGTTYHSIDDPFIVIEGKRLPTPGGKAREREYVTGGNLRTGGMQRFKLGLHGKGMPVAVMVGYIQKGTPAGWHSRINGWIANLSDEFQFDGEWTRADRLRLIARESAARVLVLESSHTRQSEMGGSLALHHFLVEMRKRRTFA